MNIEKMLRIAADSSDMPGWNDSLSHIVKKSELSMKALDDSELELVAGGVNTDQELVEKLLSKIRFDHE